MSFLKKIVTYLPDSVRWQLMRSKIKLPSEFPNELSIRLAQNSDELRAAYSIIQESYAAEGLAHATNSGMRVLKQFAMPSTATIVILWNSEVIGTVSLIRDNPLGLPLEKIFDLSAYRKKNIQLAEVSSLAISHKFRSKQGKLLFPLFKSVFHFGRDVLRVDALVIAVNPRWRDFYSGLYGFKNLKSTVVDNYDFVNGAPAIGLVFEYEPAFNELKQIYKHSPIEKNIFCQLWETNYSCITLPSQEYFSTVIRHIDANNFSEFFLKDEQSFSKLNQKEQLMVKRNLIVTKKDMLPELESIVELTPRRNHRFDVNLKARSERQTFRVHDVSREGLKIEIEGKAAEEISLILPVSPTKSSQLLIEPIWRSPINGLWGTRVRSFDQNWINFINYQEAQLGILNNTNGILNAG